MVDLIEKILALYLLLWTTIGFGIVFSAGAKGGRQLIESMQKRQWYRNVGVINSIVVFVLCLLILLG